MEGQLANSEQRGGMWKFKVTFPPKWKTYSPKVPNLPGPVPLASNSPQSEGTLPLNPGNSSAHCRRWM